MGNGASPHGPSDRAHPRLYLSGHTESSAICPGASPGKMEKSCLWFVGHFPVLCDFVTLSMTATRSNAPER